MLQQTRTEGVKAYFARWMELFPTVQALAQAPEQDVLQAWQGLGYYSRARNLRKAAQEICVQYGGSLPETAEELAKLPGIGDYTAGAIASMAFGQVVPAVDGNLQRVLARMYAVEDDILSTSGKKKLRALAEQAISPERPGDFNEAMMDLGAGVCIPKNPRCELCPVREACKALAQGRTQELPHRQKRKVQTEYYADCAIFIRAGQVLLQQRPDKGLLASMWEFPNVLAAAEPESFARLKKQMGPVGDLYWQHTHVFSHQIWHVKAYWGQEIPNLNRSSWIPLTEPAQVPLAGPYGKLFQVLCQEGLFREEEAAYLVAERGDEGK